MKKILCVFLAAVLMFGIVGCAADSTDTETTIQQETEPVQIEATLPAETVPETTEPATVDGYLYLTVSSITFTLQGESEDIYIGSIPRELVTWVSEDESVAVFEDGVLTAAGVGSTTVYAEYADQHIECTVGCLAQTEEDLSAIDMEILRSPKRYPPAVDEDIPLTYYDDAAIIGDSISYIMFQWESKLDYLGDPVFLVRGGTSINGFVRNYKNIYYKGKEMHLEDALAASGVKKAFILLGQNDLSYMTIESTMEKWELLIERIWEENPDLEIYLLSCIPEWEEDSASNEKNEKIDLYNIGLETFCDEKGCHFVDLAPYVEDHLNKMSTNYSLDKGIHMNYDGCYMWMQFLKGYAQLQDLQGE